MNTNANVPNLQHDVEDALYRVSMLREIHRPDQALETLEPVIAQVEALVAAGKFADNEHTVYRDFATLTEAVVWQAHARDPRTLSKPALPMAQTYLAHGSNLYELGRYDDAADALKRAILWNPASPLLYFELAEDYKKLGDIDSCDAALDDAYPYIARDTDLAQYHRTKAYVATERGDYELAAAHLVTSLLFQESKTARDELWLLKLRRGADYTKMGPGEAIDVLQQRDQPMNVDLGTLDALTGMLEILQESGRFGEAAQVADDLYGLTGEENVANLAAALHAKE